MYGIRESPIDHPSAKRVSQLPSFNDLALLIEAQGSEALEGTQVKRHAFVCAPRHQEGKRSRRFRDRKVRN